MSVDPLSSSDSFDPIAPSAECADDRFHALSHLISCADDFYNSQLIDQDLDEIDNQLIQVRLGVAAGLFQSLRAKHLPTASHSLRVAKLCSQWAVALQLEPFQRDQLEVAALLHDVGKIGVPDYVLACPGKLSPEEQALMDRNHEIGLEILSACCEGEMILEIIRYNYAWFDGSKGDFELAGRDIPLEARMLAIVDAFDSMTVDQIFRRARSPQRAFTELFNFAGSQFDPDLVSHFCEQQSAPVTTATASGTSRGWLKQLDPQDANRRWHASSATPAGTGTRVTAVFQESLIRHIHDAVIYVDIDMQIIGWNQAAERLTGLSRTTVDGYRWSCELLSLADHQGRRIAEENEPVRVALRSGAQAMHRLSIRNAAGKFVTVTAHVVPVVGEDGSVRGATIQLHDTSGVESLEEQIQSLHYKATRDPLTGLLNRSEMDRALVEMVERHTTVGRPFSVIICDIDFFKKINDTYGHQAGDEALTSFASLMQKWCRTDELVARYGGEEFVILCPECGSDRAASLAESIRSELAATVQPAFGGSTMTASFGVTQLQRGDSAESILNRADRALLQSKEMGRNIVTQIGGGGDTPHIGDRRGWWQRWFGPAEPEVLLRRAMKTRVPVKVAVEKIRGFVADHRAEVLQVTEQSIKMMVDGESLPLQRRLADRAVPLVIELHFEPLTAENGAQHTKVDISIAPRRNRDRRKRDAVERARHLLWSLQSYLVAYEFVDTTIATETGKSSTWWDRLWTPNDLESDSR